MKFTIANLLLLTTVMAVIVAVTSRLGVEVGFLAMFLGVADVVVSIRIYNALTEDTSDVGWTVVSACVMFPLTVLFILGMIFGNVTQPS